MRNNIRNMRNIRILDALFPGVRQRLLAATLTRPEKWWYLSEVANALQTSPSSLQREIAALVGSGILAQRRDGRRTYVKAETRSPIFRELQAIFEKTFGLIPTLQTLLRPFRHQIACAFIYGSVAREQERPTSDVNLMIIGSVGLVELAPALRRAEKRLGREINVTSYSTAEFRKKIFRSDHFLTNVLNSDVRFIIGDQSDLDSITRE